MELLERIRRTLDESTIPGDAALDRAVAAFGKLSAQPQHRESES
jgi:hypothetical protein